MKNQIYLEKRLKVIVAEKGKNTDSKMLVATISKNLESLGYVFSKQLFNRLSTLTELQISSFYLEITPILKKMRGAHRQFKPMYPNFPQQVIDMSQFELYYNALSHYWDALLVDIGVKESTTLPQYEVKERMPLFENTKADVINLGSEKDFTNIFTTLVSANSSISQSDKDILSWFVQNYKNDVVSLLPDQIPLKENLSSIAGLLLQYTTSAHLLVKYIKTPTDVLRIAVVMSGGDVSLAETTKFGKFKRSERRFLLKMLENCSSLKEEMVKYKERWIRLGERLHPSEYHSQYPKAVSAFSALRDGDKIVTFNSKVETALKDNNVDKAVDLLLHRAGDFARRLDHVLRLDDTQRNKFAKKFMSVADKVSTNVLLQLHAHFKNRNQGSIRTVFPKGNLAKVTVLDNKLPEINQKFCDKLSESIRSVLVERFSSLDKIGKIYLDEDLKNFVVPFAQRSASKALRTIVRGSKIDLDGDYDTARFFIWWKNGDYRTDIDLSACILNENWGHVATVAYYNLKDFGGHHSGDITDAPMGAAEFIDISLKQVLQRGGRYVVMSVNSFTRQPYCDLPECFAGWMGRKSANSGEIFEPKTVKNKVDLTANSTIAIPLIIDALERKVIWCDIALKQAPTWNNVANNQRSMSMVCRAIAELKKPNLYDLLSMHSEARGKLVTDKNKADVVFSAETTPYEIDKVMSEYMK